jgi:hypothetical protein
MKTNITRKTPLGAILYATFIESQLKLPEFVAEIGYRNIAKGIRALQSFVNTGTGNHLFLERIQASRFTLDADVLLDALTRTDQQLYAEREEERAKVERELETNFRPALYAVPKLDPSAQITLYAITSEFDTSCSPLPSSIGLWPTEKQYEFVQAKIRENYRRNEGRIIFLGPIVSYLYFRVWNEKPMAFSIDGQPLGVSEQRTYAKAELRIRNSPIAKKLLAQMLCTRGEASMH